MRIKVLQNRTIRLNLIVGRHSDVPFSVRELYQRCGNKISQEMAVEMFLLTGEAYVRKDMVIPCEIYVKIFKIILDKHMKLWYNIGEKDILI